MASLCGMQCRVNMSDRKDNARDTSRSTLAVAFDVHKCSQSTYNLSHGDMISIAIKGLAGLHATTTGKIII